MKKTIYINLGGTSFIIDEDAYELLNNYFETLKRAFAGEAGEIVPDIEYRVSEIMRERPCGAESIITLREVEDVIARIGNAEDLGAPTCGEGPRSTPPPYPGSTPGAVPPSAPTCRKQLYRDVDNAMLGGVCSGIAKRLNIDPTLVRLLTVLLVFLSASTVIVVYIILWIIVPPANTPIRRMEMNGETCTVGNIGRKVTEENRESGNGYGRTVLVVLAVLMMPVLIGLLFAIPVVFSKMVGEIGAGPSESWPGTMCILLFLLALLMPIILLEIAAFSPRGYLSRISRGWRLAWVSLWVLLLLGAGLTFGLYLSDTAASNIISPERKVVRVNCQRGEGI